MAICPICQNKEAVAAFKPFCCKRCADIDLHRWMGGYYAIPAVEPPDNWEETLDAGLDSDDPSKIH